MHAFNSTLLREKFLIKEAFDPRKAVYSKNKNPKGLPDLITAMSNRLVLPFRDKNGIVKEEFVIRSHTMHSCVRMARQILFEYMKDGPIAARFRQVKWDELWADVIPQKQREFDPDYWCAVYLNGRQIFNNQRHHVFFDVIEKFAFKFNCAYDKSITLAEDAFQKAGKKVNIEHENQIAAIMDVDDTRTKTSIILRSPKKTTTAIIHVSSDTGVDGYILTAFELGAYYLEGIHHSFVIGQHESMINRKETDSVSASEKIITRAKSRIIDIQSHIKECEKKARVQYRPEKPSFKKIIRDTMDFNQGGHG